MPAKRASMPTSPVKAHRTSHDVPERYAAESPAPDPEDVTPESCDAQFELIQEITQELRALQASLEADRARAMDQEGAEDYSVPSIRAFTKLRGAQTRALMGLEYLKRETARRNVERDANRVRVATIAYELAHCQAEVRAQEKFDECGEDLMKKYGIELMDEKAFIKAVGREAAKSADARELMLKRLQHELELRRAKVQERDALKRELEDVKKEEQELSKIWDAAKEQMKQVSRTLEPIRRKFDLPNTTTEALDARVKLLTMPLYVLYTQLLYVKEAREEDFTIGIFGRVEDAENWDARERARLEDDAEVNAKSETPTTNRRHQKRGRFGGRFGRSGPTQATTSSSMYDEFPLRVELVIDGCSIQFTHLTRLNVVIAAANDNEAMKRQRSAKGSAKSATQKSTTVDFDTLLVDLLSPNDAGEDSPNAATGGEDFKYDPLCTPSGGRPYKWLQKLCGLSFLPPIPADVSESDVKTLAKTARAADVVDAIRERLER